MFRDRLTSAVGPGEPNRQADVRLVQSLLARTRGFGGGRVQITGRFDKATAEAIVAFQRNVMGVRFPHSVIEPGDQTFSRLSETSPRRLLVGSLGGIILSPIDGDEDLREEDFQHIAHELECEARSVKAVQKTESRYGPYDRYGRPSLQYERHLFSRFTLRKYDGRFPAISSSIPGGYSWPEVDPYVRLQQAYALDSTAALRAASWGAFQILADNHGEAGFPTAESFVGAMCSSVSEQCDAFISFVKSNHGRLQGIREKDWKLFAYHYNGPNYKINNYDTNLALNYEQSTE